MGSRLDGLSGTLKTRTPWNGWLGGTLKTMGLWNPSTVLVGRNPIDKRTVGSQSLGRKGRCKVIEPWDRGWMG